MTPIDYLLFAGAVVAGGYVVARLFMGWLRSSAGQPEAECAQELHPPIAPERIFRRVEKTDAPWHSRK